MVKRKNERKARQLTLVRPGLIWLNKQINPGFLTRVNLSVTFPRRESQRTEDAAYRAIFLFVLAPPSLNAHTLDLLVSSVTFAVCTHRFEDVGVGGSGLSVPLCLGTAVWNQAEGSPAPHLQRPGITWPTGQSGPQRAPWSGRERGNARKRWQGRQEGREGREGRRRYVMMKHNWLIWAVCLTKRKKNSLASAWLQSDKQTVKPFEMKGPKATL